MSEVVVVDPVPQRSLLDQGPREMVISATEVANVLKDVIDKQKLYVELNKNRHVKAEGWSTLGTMLNILPKEDRVIRHLDGSFEAYISLINARNGLTVGGGSGYVGMDEKNWSTKPDYAKRSMAITRATSKAYRTCFSWIIALAGYNATPAEEMDGIIDVKPDPKKSPVAYDGCEEHKVFLQGVFDENSITDKEEKKAIHQAMVNWRVPCEKSYLDSAVKQAFNQFKTTGKIDEVPF